MSDYQTLVMDGEYLNDENSAILNWENELDANGAFPNFDWLLTHFEKAPATSPSLPSVIKYLQEHV